MTQVPAIAQSPDVAPLSELRQLEARSMQLEVRASDGQVHINQLGEQRNHAKLEDRPLLDQQLAAAQHDQAVVIAELSATRSRINDIRTLTAPAGTTVPVDREPLFGTRQLENMGLGGFLLMIPIVLAFARRIWIRGGSHQASMDLESSPRLQRMEQAIESIAIEVERIGEAQRFATKLMSERSSEPAAARIAPSTPRREPGTITPH